MDDEGLAVGIIALVLALVGLGLVLAIPAGISGTGLLFTNGTRPLTANWNAGAQNITASWFIGNVQGTITGTISSANISDWGTYIDQPLLTSSSPTFRDITLSDNVLGTPIYSSVGDFIDGSSRGVLAYGTLTDNDNNGTVTVGGGSGLIRTSDSVMATLKFISWNGSNLALTDETLNYIYINYTSGVPTMLVTTDFHALMLHNTNIIIGEAFRRGLVVEVVQGSGFTLEDFIPNDYSRLEHRGIELMSGAMVTEKGTRYLYVTIGVYYQNFKEINTALLDTTVANNNFTAVYRDGIGGWTYLAGQTQFSNSLYDDNSGTPKAIDNAKYATYYVYQCMEGDVYVQYGQSKTLTLAQARAEATPTPPTYLSEWAYLRAKIIILKGATNAEEISIYAKNSFIFYAVSNHNELAGLDGGSAGAYYHLNSTEHGYIVNLNQALSTTSNVNFGSVTLGGNLILGANTITTSNTSLVSNLNADLLDGQHGSYYRNATNINTGTLGLTYIPTMDDVHIPNVETLSYGGAFATAQIPSLDASKITSGTFGTARLDLSALAQNIAFTSTQTVDGIDISAYINQAVLTTSGPTFDHLHLGGLINGVTTLSMNNQLTNTLAIGTAPFVITSTTKVANLNVEQVDGYDLNQALLTTSSPTFVGLLGSPYMDVYPTDYGTVLNLDFEEGIGATAFDKSPYGNDGTITGATWVAGKFGKALSFDGVNDIVTTTMTGMSGNLVTVSFWMNWTGGAENYEHPLTLGTYDLSFYVDNTGYFAIAGDIGETFQTISQNTQYFVVATYDGTNLRLYLNGVLKVTVAGTLSFANYNVDIGARGGGFNNWFGGIIDEVRVYNRALSADEVKTRWLNSQGKYSSSTIISDKFRVLGTDLATDFSVINGAGVFAGGLTVGSDVVSDTADTDSLGSSTKEWLNGYFGNAGKLYLGLAQDVSIHRSALNTMTLTASAGVITSAGLTVGGQITGYYMSGDYGLTWTQSMPSGVNGMMVTIYNSNAGILASRWYIYTNGAWKYSALV